MSFIPGANVGPYRIVEQAERSGVATTYTAYQPSLGRYVSLVVAPAIDREDVELLRQYRRQLDLVLTLRHPNILTVIDHGEHLDVPFVVTETVEAEPLAERLGAPWPPNEVVRVLRPIAAALDYAHGLGVVHGDVRSSSVLLTPDGTPILSGFGLLTHRLAVPAGSSLDEATWRASSISEEVEWAQPADRRGLALIAYEMLTGRTMDVDVADFERPLSPAQIGSPLLATPVERVLLRELTGDAGDRYPSATAFVDDLATPVESSRPNGVTPASVAPLSPTVRMPPAASSTSGPASRRPLMTVALIIAALALLGALATLLRGGEDSRPFAPSSRAPDSEGSVPGASLSTNVAATPVSGVPASEAAGSGMSAPAASAASTDSQPSGTSGTTSDPVAQPTAPSASASGQADGPAAGAGSAPASGTPARSGPSISVLVSTPGATTGAVQPGAASAVVAAQPGATPTMSTPRPATAIPPVAGSTRLPVTWRVVGDPSGRWMLDDQGRVAGRTETGASVVLFPESVDDIAFSAMVDTATCQATLVFRAQDDDNLLMVIYIPDGLPAPGTAGGGVWLYQRVEGLDLPIRAVRPSTVRPAGEPARLKIVTSGPNISIFLNAEPALQAVDTAPRSGRLGLMVYSTSGRLCEATFGEIER